jgi:hypothetical protein
MPALFPRFVRNPWSYPPDPPRGHVKRWWRSDYGPANARVWTVRDTANLCAVCGHAPKRGSYRRLVRGLMCCETCARLVEAMESVSTLST